MDLISRQAAIDAISRVAREKFNLSDEYNQYLAGLMDAQAEIESLPSAQTGIIRCKDCKWFGDIGCAIKIVDASDRPTEMDFCSFAEKGVHQ